MNRAQGKKPENHSAVRAPYYLLPTTTRLGIGVASSSISVTPPTTASYSLPQRHPGKSTRVGILGIKTRFRALTGVCAGRS